MPLSSKEEKMDKKRIISEICNSGCTTPFDCKRKAWQKFPETGYRFGNDVECPLMQFPAEKDESDRPWYAKESITESDTWSICESCRYAEIKDGYVCTDACFSDHCMDCSILHIRDSILEGQAEMMVNMF